MYNFYMTRIWGFFRLILVILSLSPSSLYSETLSSDIERADQLGKEFQRQMPWSKDIPKSGAYEGMTQPEGYYFAPEKELSEEEMSKMSKPPYCYNPGTYRYEYCYPSYDNLKYYDHNKYRLRLPGFYLYWGHGEKCPPKYHFSPERGCYEK